ncbi:MAG: hypothetical protein IJJ38_12055 [Lachnospiraceae bacterium]|nr:hypothetical protein [Lachnospiraceae bacterium]
MKAISRRSGKIAANTAYTIAGALVLNGVLQLFVYPRAARYLGTAAYGDLLYVMAYVNILGPSVGQALNNSRLVMRRGRDVSNGDYNIMILLFSAAGIAVSLFLARAQTGGAAAGLLFAALILLTNFRYYGDVEYRLSLDYRRYFFYYTICGAGYAAGFLFYRLTGNWYLIFLAGEAAAFLWIFFTGGIYKGFFVRSPYFSEALRKGGLLVLSYFVTNLTLNIDRLFLKHAVGEEAVAVYYVLSLIGKTLVLFVAPVNTIVISYLTKENTKVTKKRFLQFAGAGMGAAALFFVFCQIATPLYIRLFYPQLLEETAGLVTVVNATQILAMLSAYLFIIALTFSGAKWQLLLQTAHLAVLSAMIVPMSQGGSLRGFAAAVLIANAARIAAVLVLGAVKAE